MDGKKKELLKKLKTLAERGVGGEKEGAERKHIHTDQAEGAKPHTESLVPKQSICKSRLSMIFTENYSKKSLISS